MRIVWITLLALKDENGCVWGAPGWLADRARVSEETCEKALKMFKAPDPKSRTMANEGRKIVTIEGGWQVLNHELYRDGMERLREKWRRQKAAQRLKRSEPLAGESAAVRAAERGDESGFEQIAEERGKS